MSPLYSFVLFVTKILFTTKVLCFPLGNETLSVYDQRQNGKYNIQISLRDVAIIEVDKNEFSDETINNSDEYYYDDEDFTITPISNLDSSIIKTTQLIENTSKTEDTDLENDKNFIKNQLLPYNKLKLLESSFDSNSSIPIKKPESNMGVSVAKKLVSHIPIKSNTHKRTIVAATRSVMRKIPGTCKKYQFRDAKGNCRSLGSYTILNSLFEMLKLMETKN